LNHTPGPWEWFDGTPRGVNNIHLATPNRGHLVVMDFVRLGTQSAQPRFATWKGHERERMGGIMVKAVDLGDFANNHPDARLIAAAPELLTACLMALPAMESAVASACDDEDTARHAHEHHTVLVALRAAISKAKGGA
jgi:hypothetical protein